MKKFVLLSVAILIFSIFLIPISFSQLPSRECEGIPLPPGCSSQVRNTEDDFAYIGFIEDNVVIPVSGSVLSIGPGEDLFIQSNEQVIVTLGISGQEYIFRATVPTRVVTKLEFPAPGNGEIIEYSLRVQKTSSGGDDEFTCVSLQNDIDELRKDMQERGAEISRLRNTIGGFGNQTLQGILVRMQLEQEQDRDTLETLESQFTFLDCTRIPRDEQQRPENRPTEEASFQESTIFVVGPVSIPEFNPDLSLLDNSLILTKDNSLEIAILEPSDELTMFNGEFGTIEYPSVINPNSEYLIRYNNTLDDFTPSGEIIEFVLESPRKVTVDASNMNSLVSLEKNGTIAYTSFSVISTTESTGQFIIPEIGKSIAGDAPLQYGLHFIHIFSNSPSIGNLNTYVPVYVVPSGQYKLIAHSLSSDDQLMVYLDTYLPSSPELHISGKSHGVTTFSNLKQIEIPISSIVVKDNVGPIPVYNLDLSGDFNTGFFKGQTFVLGNTYQDTFSISGIKIFNFAISDFNIIDGDNSIGFPDSVEINVDVNTVDIAVFDEFEQPFIEGTIIIEKGNEEFTSNLIDLPRLKLPDGEYTITHLIDGQIESQRTEVINESGLIIFNVTTLEQQDQIFTIIILLESIIVLFLTIKLLLKYFKG